jgi:hypothetical protein
MVIDLKNATIKLKDGGSNEMTVKLGEGNLTYDEKRNIQYILDRGNLDEVRLGDQVPVDVKLDAVWEHLTSDTNITVEDALKQRGLASDWVSSDADVCRPYAVDIEVTLAPPCGDTGETILLPDFRYESASHDMKGGTLSFSGKCNVVEATVTAGSGS